MEPKFQSSFIPKTNSQETAVPKEVERAHGPRDGGGLWSFIANSIFTLAIVGLIAVFGAKWYLERSLVSMGDSLAAAREELDPERIQEINRSYERILAAQTLLSQHVILSNFFEKLQASTVKNMRLSDLNFSMASNKGATITFKGEAIGYVAVAQAVDVFTKNNLFKSQNFYDLDLNSTGAVSFAFKGELDEKIFIPQIETPSENEE